MRVNTQFPVAVHILAGLVIKKDEPLNSERLARSVNTNPVVVRRILSQLKKAGLTQTKPDGTGFMLSKPAHDISLRDIYTAMRGKSAALFDTHGAPSQNCVIGRHILSALQKPLCSAQWAMEAELSRWTLSDVVKKIKELESVKEAVYEKNF